MTKRLPSLVPIRYAARALAGKGGKSGWDQFVEDSQTLDRAGYDLVGMAPLGAGQFGVVWKLTRSTKDAATYANFIDEFAAREPGELDGLYLPGDDEW